MAFHMIIVDDDETLLEGLRTAVNWGDMDLEVSAVATDGKKALQVLREHACDVLLTDIRMGRMDGLKLAETVLQKYEAVRIVMMSAYEDFSYAQQALRLGAEDYLLKPIDLKQLDQTMRRVVEGLERGRFHQARILAADQRMEALNRHVSDAYAQVKSTLDTPLIDKLAKVTLLGNQENVLSLMERLKGHLMHVDDASGVFTATAVGLLSEQLETCEQLSTVHKEALYEIRKDATSGERVENTVAQLSACLHSIAREIAEGHGNIQSLILRAKAYVDIHFKESSLRIREVSEYVGLSANYFSTMFVKYVGQSFSDYLMYRRMEEAQILTSQTNMLAYEIAFEVGYDTPAYFSTSFKNYTGKTVSQYRKAFHM